MFDNLFNAKNCRQNLNDEDSSGVSGYNDRTKSDGCFKLEIWRQKHIQCLISIFSIK